jgi:hypothetical protein
MDCKDCSVFPNHGGWMATLETGIAGPYLTHDMALQLAIGEALRFRRAGQPARVSVLAANGAVRVERCLCGRVGSCKWRRAA